MAIAHATVLHDLASTFGFPAEDGRLIRVRAVATFAFPTDGNDEQVLELLFRATNTVASFSLWSDLCDGSRVYVRGSRPQCRRSWSMAT